MSRQMSKNTVGLLALVVSLQSAWPAMGQTQAQSSPMEPVVLGSHAASAFHDPRLKKWSADFLTGKRASVESAVAADLASASPHPFAQHVWMRIQESLGRNKDQAVELAPAMAKAQIQLLANVEKLLEQHRYDEVVKLLPPDKLPDVLDPWTLSELARSADEANLLDLAFAYRLANWQRNPDSFGPVWEFIDFFSNRELPDLRARLLQQLKPAADQGLLSAKLLTSFINDRGMLPLDQLHMALRFGESDWHAMRFAGATTATLNRWKDSEVWRTKAETAYPFRNNAIRIAVTQMRQGQFDAAKATIKSRSLLFASGGDQAQLIETQYLVDAYGEAGELGKQRALLEVALKRWPKVVAFEYALAELEDKSARPNDAAAHWHEVTKLTPKDPSGWAGLVSSLRQAREKQEALDAYAQAVASGVQISARLFNTMLGTLQDTNQHAEVVRLAGEETTRRPQSAWTLRNLAESLQKLKRLDDARLALDKGLDIEVTRWTLDRYVEVIDASAGGNDPHQWDALFATLQSRYPHSKDMADVLEARLTQRQGGNRSLLVAATDKEIALAPTLDWPYYYRAWEAMQAGRVEEVQRIITQGLDAMPPDWPGRRAALLLNRADLIYRAASGAARVESKVLDQALADVAQAESLGCDMARVYQTRYKLYSLKREGSRALSNLTLWHETEPDNLSPFQQLARFELEPVQAQQFVAIHRLVERNPYDKKKLGDAVHYHARWGGSPVLALAYARDYGIRFPDDANRRAYELQANQALESAMGLRLTLSDAGSYESPSDRYIRWFDSRRRRAQSDANFLLPEKLDLVNMRATAVTPDGIEFEKGFHPVSGKPTLIRVGRAFIEAKYDESGRDLVEIKDSSGTRISLNYDARHNIEQISTSAGQLLTFIYDEASHPTTISVKGVGTIEVTYDEQGEISHVESPGGAKVSLAVTQAFQTLLGQVNAFSKSSAATVPQLPFSDPVLTKIQQREQAGKLKTSLDVAAYLVNHIGDRAAYASDADARLQSIIKKAAQSNSGPDLLIGVDATVLWHQLATLMHPHGLSAPDWMKWQETLAWLDRVESSNPGVRARVVSARSQFTAKPLQLLPNAKWLPKSYVDNPGSWRHFFARQVLPSGAEGIKRTAVVVVRKNGDVVLGNDQGLAVWRRGFWEWLSYDADKRRYSFDGGGTAAAITSLAEDGAGNLWVGSNNGLMMLSSDYVAPVKRWASKATGMPSPTVTALAAYGEGVLVGTGEGLRYFTASGDQALPAALMGLASTPITMVKSFPVGTEQPIALFSTNNKLLSWTKGGLQEVAPHIVQDAVVHDGKLFTLRQNEIQVRRLSTSGIWDQAKSMNDQSNIVFSKEIHGFGSMPLDDGSFALTVLTDSGVAIFKDEHFEFKKMPGADRDVAVWSSATGKGRTVLSTADGVYLLANANVRVDTNGRVFDILTSQAFKATFIARGNRLEAVLHEHAERGPRIFDALNSTHLAQLPDGSIVTNDGLRIVRFAPGSRDEEMLFSAQPQDDGSAGDVRLTSLIVASDGTIWATAGPSVFRFSKGELSEFSMYVDADKFPVLSDMISRVVETVDHRIWVVASQETHRQYRGQNMEGGLLEWSGDRFVKKSPGNSPWFFTSYTPVGPNQAIAGTNAGFALQRNDQLEWLSSQGDPSYKALSVRQPALALGTQGAKFGEDTWLFGTPGGLVAWHAGQWILPDRLNWLLPAPELANYGGRMVHAVSTDDAGRIYAGTDRGLMIYEAGSKDIAQFLVEANLPDLAFSSAEHRKLVDEAQSFLKAMPEASPVGQLVKAHADSSQKLAELRQQKQQSSPLLSADKAKAVSAPDLDAQLDQQEKAHKTLLARLEKDAFGLYQMLELKPIDLAVWRKRLPEDAVVVQYLPTDKKLMIHIASQTRSEIREVDIAASELFLHSAAVAEALAKRSMTLRGDDRGVSVGGKSPGLMAQALLSGGPSALREELHWLYERLLRPVEREIAGYKHVYVSPVGALAHLPFGALVRSQTDAGVEYAVQRYQIGVLPSLYLLDLVLRDQSVKSGVPTIFGNPDGSLPGAEREAQAIKEISGKDTVVNIGPAASVATLREQAQHARWLHLATHGVLNGADPTMSYLVMAKGEHLSMVDAMQLPLQHTETVVLSACETGAGASGLDYATLSRAFSYAGAPSVVASLWKVHDGATSLLMTNFYKHRQEGQDVFQALASAQTDMIKLGGEYSAPEAWSGFLAFGRP